VINIMVIEASTSAHVCEQRASGGTGANAGCLMTFISQSAFTICYRISPDVTRRINSRGNWRGRR